MSFSQYGTAERTELPRSACFFGIVTNQVTLHERQRAASHRFMVVKIEVLGRARVWGPDGEGIGGTLRLDRAVFVLTAVGTFP